jgi:hypothetical protein
MTQATETQATTAKRVVFAMGGKGGVGKTGVMVGLAEWFAAKRDPRDTARLGHREQGPWLVQALFQRLRHEG